MKNKLIIVIAIALVAIIPVFAAAQEAPSSGGSTSSLVEPSESPTADGSDSSLNGTPTPTPEAGDSGSSLNSSTNPPSSGGSGSTVNSAPSSAPSSGGSSSTLGSPAPTNPPTNPGNDGDNDDDSTGGSSNLGGSRRSGGVFASINSCPLISSYLKMGAANDPVQVSRLQAFLKNNEGLNVDVNGIFDLKTLNAVKAFQAKYQPTILGPWGSKNATGYVYITTTKKINELACAEPLVLNASELAIINSFRNRQTQTAAVGNLVIPKSSEPSEVEVTVPGEGNTVVILGGNSTSTNTANVSDVGIFTRFWQFIKNLFSRIF